MPHERRAGRALVIAPDGATLLVLGHDPNDVGRGHFYWTPGGGVDEGESVEDAARRELAEEVGHVAGDLGPVVLHRVSEFDFGGRRLRQTEDFFAVIVAERFEARPQLLSPLENDAIVAFQWLTPDDMRVSQWTVYPRCLPALIDEIISNGPPAAPWSDIDG